MGMISVLTYSPAIHIGTFLYNIIIYKKAKKKKMTEKKIKKVYLSHENKKIGFHLLPSSIFFNPTII